MNEKIKYLKNSPLYNMSLASMELFHSNFWAWLMEKDVTFVNSLLGTKFTDTEDYKVERENKRANGGDSRDIVILPKIGQHQNCEYIIENKIKALPDMKQLRRYEENSGSSFIKGIITGIIEPKFLKEEGMSENWKFVSYQDICTHIENSNYNSNSNLDEFEKDLIKQYCKMVTNVFNVIIYGVTNVTIDEALKGIRLFDIISKLRASVALSQIAEEVEKEIKINNKHYYLCIEQGFSRNNATINFFFGEGSKENGEYEKSYKIGIQIQGNAYRRIVTLPNISNKMTKEILFNENKSTLSNWFDYDVRSDKYINFSGQHFKTSMKNTTLVSQFAEKKNELMMLHQNFILNEAFKKGLNDQELHKHINTSSSREYSTELQQGYNLIRHYSLIEADDTGSQDRFIHYQFQTNEFNVNDNEAWFGIVRGWSVENAYSPKPGYMMVANYFAQMENAVFEEAIQEETEFIYKHKRPDGMNVFTFYSDRGNVVRSYDLGSESGTLYDVYGNKLADLTSVDGKFTFVLNDTPHYFVTAAAKLEKCDNVITVSDSLAEVTKGSTAEFVIDADKTYDIELSTNDSTLETSSEVNGKQISVKTKVLEIPEKFDFTARRHQYGTEEKRDYVFAKLSSEGKTYAYLPLGVDYVEWEVDARMTVEPFSDTNTKHWKNVVTITNNTDKPVSGTVSIAQPSSMAERIRPARVENLGAGKTTRVEFNMPVDTVEAFIARQAVYTSDTGEVIDIYLGDYPRSYHFNQPGAAMPIRIINRAKEETVIDGVINESEWKGYRMTSFDKNEASYGASNYVVDGVVYKDTFGADADYGGKEDFSGEIYTKWDSEYLYVAAAVKDDVHYQEEPHVKSILDDTFYISPKETTTQRHDTRIDMSLTNLIDYESKSGYSNVGLVMHWTPIYGQQFYGLIDTVENAEEYGAQVMVVRKDPVTIYEARIPWEMVHPAGGVKYENFYMYYTIRDYDGDRDKTYGYGGWYCLID